METRVGKGKAVKDAAAEAEAPRPAVQLSLLGGPEAVDMEEAAAARRRGRPPGSQNMATRELRDFLAATYRHPLVTLARIQAMDPLELARDLKCKPLEALDRINRAAADLAPYLASKMPMEVDFKGAMPVFNLVTPEAAVAFYAEQAGAAGPLIEMADFRHSLTAEEEAVGRSESDAIAEAQAPGGSGGGGQVICDQLEEGE